MIRSHVVSLSVACLICAAWISSATAQVFYEPVQYQYHYGSHAFYYGGHNPRMFDFATSEIRTRAYGSVATTEHVRRGDRVYSDSIPYANLADNSYTGYDGFTANDARNEAYNNVPRYFRKSDLLRAAVVTDEGTLVVPAQAQPIIDIRVVRPFAMQPAPVVPKGTILVIPKEWLKRRIAKPDSSVANAAQ